MIDGIDGTRRIAPGRLANIRASRSDFRMPDDGLRSDTPPLAATASTSLVGMIALQAELEERGPLGDREAHHHGREILRRLTLLQREMLRGPLDTASLRELAGLAASLPEAADPLLRAALAAIQLRARVELARHGMISGQE